MFTVGTDPEFLIVNPAGEPVPAHSVGIGDKHNKHEVERLGAGAAYFRDGYVLEGNVGPETCKAYMMNNVREVLQTVQKTLPKGFSITTRSAFKVKASDLTDAPDDVKQFGCDPSWDGYSGSKKMVRLDGETHLARYAGAHLHFSTMVSHNFKVNGTEEWQDGTIVSDSCLANRDNYPSIAQLMDKYVGQLLAYLYDGPEQFARRAFYGQAGEFRPQTYETVIENAMRYKDGWVAERGQRKSTSWGFEYRTPPSELWNHNAVVGLAVAAGRYVLANFSKLKIDLAEQEFIRGAIQTGEGLGKHLPTIGGLYTPSVIKKLKERPEIHEFGFIKSDHECHMGWGEFAQQWEFAGVRPS